MSLVVEPDLYQVSVDDNGTYINCMPPLNTIKNGIRCPCGSRKNQIFKTSTSLSKHFDCDKHKMWLKNLNLSKINHYNELVNSKELINQQKIIIRELKLELQEKDKMIINLTKNIIKDVPVANLLEF
tara:strand:- start:586 stop:966 length:381 start_codon:yes stop_codon:yes gene_type:complete